MKMLDKHDLVKIITAKNENVGQTYLKKHLNYTILMKHNFKILSFFNISATTKIYLLFLKPYLENEIKQNPQELAHVHTLFKMGVMKPYVMTISKNSNHFLMGIERSFSQKGIIKVYQNISIQP